MAPGRNGPLKITQDTFGEVERNTEAFLLKRSLFGREDASRIWNQLRFKEFQKMGFREMNPVSYVIQKMGMMLIYYIDDVTVLTENAAAIEKLKEDLSGNFRNKDLGAPSQFLRIELDLGEICSIKMKQSGLIKTLLSTTGIMNAKVVASPTSHSLTDVKMIDSEPLDVKDLKEFRSIVGSLIYV